MEVGIILSVTVGILSLLVMALIGWQVYTLIDLRKIRKEVDEKRKLVNFESERNMCVSAMALSDFYYSLLVNETIVNKEFKYIHYRIAALLHASRIDNYDTCNAIIRTILESVTDKLKVSKYNKSLLLDLLQEVENKKMIPNFHTLMRFVLNIEESD